MIIENFGFWLLFISMSSVVSILVGIINLLKARANRETLHDSISAFSTYLKDSLKVFLKRQLFLIGISITLIILITVLMHFLLLDNTLLTHFIIWGIVWSCIIGYFFLRISSTATGHFLQQSLKDYKGWKKNVGRMGWALTLIPLGLLSLNFVFSICFMQQAIIHNWFNVGTVIMRKAALQGPWTQDILQNPLFETARRQKLSFILAAYCFGALIQALMVKIATLTMAKSTQLSSDHVAYNYPGLDTDDLRSPLSLAHHISQYTNRIWGGLSTMINTYLIVFLSATAISISAFQENPSELTGLLSRLPVLITAFGLIGGSITSFFHKKSLFQQLCISAFVSASLSCFCGIVNLIPLNLLVIILLSLCTGISLFYLQTRCQENSDSGIKKSLNTLTYTWVSFMIILAWMGITFSLCDGVAHILLGLNGMALGGVSILGLWLVTTAYTHRNSFIQLTMANANILHVQEDMSEAVIKTVQDASKHNASIVLFKTILVTVSMLMILFIFLSATPNWLEKITRPELIEQLRNNYESLTHIVISESETAYLLANVSFTGIAFFLGISPTRPLFLFGLFSSLSIVMGLGLIWIRAISKIETTLVNNAVKQLEENPLILEGQVLPDYDESIKSVTAASFKTSSLLGLLLCLAVPISVLLIGIRGLIGLLLGMVFLTLVTGVYAYSNIHDQEDSKEELTFTLTALATQTMLLFAYLFGLVLLQMGCAL